jgi:putative restriction endonuclease
LVTKDLEYYVSKFKALNVNRSGGHASPHKPSMLLAVLELAESGHLLDNKIPFDDVLLTRYAAYFEIVRSERDHLNPWMPYFHLRKDGFWHHVPLPGREAILVSKDSARQRKDVVENIDHVHLDAELHGLMRNADQRHLLRELLVLYWFPDHQVQLFELARVAAEEEQILNEPLKHLRDASNLQPSRSAAFRRIVTEAYGFRCAATGWRVVLPDYSVLVEAAHIIPFSETQDDRPQNGIALTPNFHWAMDRSILAPGPDLKWHVSKSLDDRIADNEPLVAINGSALILPKDPRFRPDPDALEWRLTQLR